MPHNGVRKSKSVSEFHVGPEIVDEFLEGLTDNMVVILPSACVQAAGIKPNINDKQKPKELWIGRMKHLKRLMTAEVFKHATEPDEVRRSFLQAALQEVESRKPDRNAHVPMMMADLPAKELVRMARAAIVIQRCWRNCQARQANSMELLCKFSSCVIKGFVVFMCGSTGISGDSLRYLRMLGGMGYLVIAPDDLAGKSSLRKRAARLIIRPDDATDYWQRNLMYSDEKASGEMVYFSSSEEFIKDPQRFDNLYNNIITVRQAELAFTLRRLPMFIKRAGITLFGMSEGSIVLSSFHDAHFAPLLRARILASYSCEHNYWNISRPEDVGIAGCAEVPTLNMMGFDDEYFGVRNSIAVTVAAALPDHPPIHGHALEAMVQRGLHYGLVVHFESGKHALTLTHDDVIRELLADFLDRPQYVAGHLPLLWSRFAALQNHITRVKHSYNEQVLYCRIRPPPVTPPPDSSQNAPALLSRLTQLLAEMSSGHDDSPHHSFSAPALGVSDGTGEHVASPHLAMPFASPPRILLSSDSGLIPFASNSSSPKGELAGNKGLSLRASQLARILSHVLPDPFLQIDSSGEEVTQAVQAAKAQAGPASASSLPFAAAQAPAGDGVQMSPIREASQEGEQHSAAEPAQNKPAVAAGHQQTLTPLQPPKPRRRSSALDPFSPPSHAPPSGWAGHSSSVLPPLGHKRGGDSHHSHHPHHLHHHHHHSHQGNGHRRHSGGLANGSSSGGRRESVERRRHITDTNGHGSSSDEDASSPPTPHPITAMRRSQEREDSPTKKVRLQSPECTRAHSPHDRGGQSAHDRHAGHDRHARHDDHDTPTEHAGHTGHDRHHRHTVHHSHAGQKEDVHNENGGWETVVALQLNATTELAKSAAAIAQAAAITAVGSALALTGMAVALLAALRKQR